MTDKKSTHQEINIEELNALIERVEHAIENELALSVDDLKLLLSAIHTLSTLQRSLEDKNATLYKLRKLLGMIKQSERRPSGNNNLSNKKRNKNSKGKNNNKKHNKPPKVVHHALEGIKKGDTCPECQRGRLYKFDPGQLLRISGHAPYEATQHVSECIRCNACQAVITANLPQEVLDDGAPNQRYGYSARALMVLHKFYSGLPYYHQGNLSAMMGVAITASTIFDQCEYVANAIMPIFYELLRMAANAKLFLMDDTPHRILTQQPEERPNRNGSGTRERTGVYTSGLVAYTDEGHEIVLFQTSLGHAGEFIDELLKKRVFAAILCRTYLTRAALLLPSYQSEAT